MSKRPFFIILFLIIISGGSYASENFAFAQDQLYNSDQKNQGDNIKEKDQEGITDKIPEITASVDRTEARVGDLIELTLRFSLPEGSEYNPEAGIEGFEGLTITGKQVSKEQAILTILVDKTQSFEIGPISLSFKDSNGDLNIIRTEALHIDVLSNLGEKPAEAKLKPIMDILPTYPLWKKLLPWILGILIVILIGAGIYYWRKTKHRERESVLGLRPAHVVAREEIEKLISMNLIDKGRHKDFYFRFSEILRMYIERLRGFPAAELTTEEIARRIRDERDRKLVPLLREADIVKFADARPTKARNEEDVKAALNYIRETTSVPSVADHGSTAGEAR